MAIFGMAGILIEYAKAGKIMTIGLKKSDRIWTETKSKEPLSGVLAGLLSESGKAN
jgi:hypothetical protein